jgi:hypothetical protein
MVRWLLEGFTGLIPDAATQLRFDTECAVYQRSQRVEHSDLVGLHCNRCVVRLSCSYLRFPVLGIIESLYHHPTRSTAAVRGNMVSFTHGQQQPQHNSSTAGPAVLNTQLVCSVYEPKGLKDVFVAA